MPVIEIKKEPIEHEESTLNLNSSAPTSKVCTMVLCIDATMIQYYVDIVTLQGPYFIPGGSVYVPGVWLWDC